MLRRLQFDEKILIGIPSRSQKTNTSEQFFFLMGRFMLSTLTGWQFKIKQLIISVHSNSLSFLLTENIESGLKFVSFHIKTDT